MGITTPGEGAAETDFGLVSSSTEARFASLQNRNVICSSKLQHFAVFASIFFGVRPPFQMDSCIDGVEQKYPQGKRILSDRVAM